MVVESTPPQSGGDVHLTIRRDLQQRLYEMFGRRIAALPDSPGGSNVCKPSPVASLDMKGVGLSTSALSVWHFPFLGLNQ